MSALTASALRPDAQTQSRRWSLDLPFLIPVLALLAIGIAMVYSSSFVVAHTVYGNETHFFARHLAWVAIGLIALLVVAHLDYSFWRRIAWPLYALSLLFLALVLVPGVGQSRIDLKSSPPSETWST